MQEDRMEGVIYAVAAALAVVLLFVPARARREAHRD
jgi:hypothetical protein